MRDALLRSRCSSRDWRVWCARAQEDAVWSQTRTHAQRVQTASLALQRFCDGARGYIGVSWGKDSCAVLLMALRLGIDWPLVHIDLDPVRNPDCFATRDAWLERFPELAARYHEITVRCEPKVSTQRYDTNAAYAQGFADARRRFGSRYVSGVRAEEAGTRERAMRKLGRGDSESATGRPIGWWTSSDVFAFCRDVPLAPAYPCTLGGAYDRGRVRVNNLWGLYGEGHGRREWEARYYGHEIALLRQRFDDPTADPRKRHNHQSGY